MIDVSRPVTRGRIWARLLSVAASAIALPVGAAQPAADSAERFPIYEFRVLGNSVLPPATIEAAVYPSLGPDGSLAVVETARAALVEAYRAAGFGTAFVDIPEQSVDDGVVRLQVTEGRLDRVRVTGAEYSSIRELRALVPTATRGRTPNLRTLQSELQAAMRINPDRQVTPLLRAGRTPGTVDMELRVDDAPPVHGSLEVNDRYTADTSELRANAVLSYDYLFGRPQSLSLQYQWSPEEPGETEVWALSWVRRSASSPAVWVAYAVDSSSDVAALGTLTVLGQGRIFGARYVRPAETPAGWLRAFSLGADYKDFEEDVRLLDGDQAQTPISYLLWSAGLTQGRDWSNGSFSVEHTLSLGLRTLGNTSAEFAFKRFGGRPNFVYLRGNAGIEQRLPWGVTAALRSRWQYAPAPLIGNEQFGLGGVETVRGYLEAEALVDSGIAGTLELATPLLRPAGETWPGVRLLAFVDAGVGRIEQPLPRQTAQFDLSSFGAGLAVVRSPLLDANLGWARTFVPAERTDAHEDRFHFSFRVGF